MRVVNRTVGMMVFIPLVVVLIDHFCREVIGRQDLKLQ